MGISQVKQEKSSTIVKKYILPYIEDTKHEPEISI